uniref:Uncharacterized protein n=1 Tax=Anguilla anguilla TaxID=7936 RepID=A0A0E9QDJ1_ANGAN
MFHFKLISLHQYCLSHLQASRFHVVQALKKILHGFHSNLPVPLPVIFITILLLIIIIFTTIIVYFGHIIEF